MMTRLKRTTAIAAIATLPLATAAYAGCGPDDATHAAARSAEQAMGAEATGHISDRAAADAAMTGAPAASKAEKGTIGAETMATAADPVASDDHGFSTADKTGNNAIKGKPAAAAAAAAANAGAGAGATTAADADANDAQPDDPDTMKRRDVVKGTVPYVAPAQEEAQAESQVENQAGNEAESGSETGAGEDLLIATVGDAEIRRSDVLGVIRMLPPQLQQQPPEMLVPMALDQLVLRQLILQQAVDDGLESHEAVEALDADATATEREDIMVQTWLDREMDGAVTEVKVDEAYGEVRTELGDEAPALEEIRPQIEQELRRRAFNEISTELQSTAEITVYGPDGQPMQR